jgi:hypothetical protein
VTPPVSGYECTSTRIHSRAGSEQNVGVVDRLSPLDASFLFAEHRTAAMHVGAVMTFAPGAGGSGQVRMRRSETV